VTTGGNGLGQKTAQGVIIRGRIDEQQAGGATVTTSYQQRL